MPYLDGAPVGEDIATGALVMEDNQIFKVVRPPEKDGKKLMKLIADFAIDVLAKSADNQYLININQTLTVDTLDFTASLNQFKAYVRPYFFKGSVDDLETVVGMMCEQVNREGENNLIVIKDFVGFYEAEDQSISFWIFEDRIFITHKKGEKLKVPQTLLFGNQQVLKVDDKWISIDQSGINRALIPIFTEPEDYTLELFLSQWLAQIHNKTLLYSFLGWIISSFFLEHINKLRKARFFPFYVVTAGTEVGKTALLSNCIHMFGVSYTGENYASSVTRFVEMLEFSKVSHLPIWRDEYKNEKYALDKESWIRSVYTRSNSSRGDKDQTTKSYPTRATLLLSGEDITEDPALSRRMIKMRLSKNDKVSKAQHEENTKNAVQNFGKAFPLILGCAFDDATFLEIYNNTNLVKDTAQKDELMCYASLGAIFGKDVALKAINEANEYHERTTDDIINQNQATAEDFFLSLDSYFLEKGWYESIYNSKPKVLDYFYCVVGKDAMYLKFPALHQLLARNRGREEYKWSKKALGQLIQEAYFARMQPRVFWGESAYVMIIEDISELSDGVGDLFSKIVTIQKKWEDKESGIDLPNL